MIPAPPQRAALASGGAPGSNPRHPLSQSKTAHVSELLVQQVVRSVISLAEKRGVPLQMANNGGTQPGLLPSLPSPGNSPRRGGDPNRAAADVMANLSPRSKARRNEAAGTNTAAFAAANPQAYRAITVGVESLVQTSGSVRQQDLQHIANSVVADLAKGRAPVVEEPQQIPPSPRAAQQVPSRGSSRSSSRRSNRSVTPRQQQPASALLLEPKNEEEATLLAEIAEDEAAERRRRDQIERQLRESALSPRSYLQYRRAVGITGDEPARATTAPHQQGGSARKKQSSNHMWAALQDMEVKRFEAQQRAKQEEHFKARSNNRAVLDTQITEKRDAVAAFSAEEKRQADIAERARLDAIAIERAIEAKRKEKTAAAFREMESQRRLVELESKKRELRNKIDDARMKKELTKAAEEEKAERMRKINAAAAHVKESLKINEQMKAIHAEQRRQDAEYEIRLQKEAIVEIEKNEARRAEVERKRQERLSRNFALGAKTAMSLQEQAAMDEARADAFRKEKNRREVEAEKALAEKRYHDRLQLQSEILQQLKDQDAARKAERDQDSKFTQQVIEADEEYRRQEVQRKLAKKAQTLQYQHDVMAQMAAKVDADDDPAVTLAMNDTERKLNKNLIDALEQGGNSPANKHSVLP